MSKQKTTIDLGRYRLVRYDRMNWLMEEFRKPCGNSGARAAKSDEPRWRSTGHYFGSIGAGVSWLLEHEMLNGGGEYDLEGAILRFGEIAAELRNHVNMATEGI